LVLPSFVGGRVLCGVIGHDKSRPGDKFQIEGDGV
jgi:hypothetical protein